MRGLWEDEGQQGEEEEEEEEEEEGRSELDTSSAVDDGDVALGNDPGE